MSKADRIRALHDGIRSTRLIAEMVGCTEGYVRVAARQRVPGGSYPDRAYHKRRHKHIMEHGDRSAARAARAVVYRYARDQGLSVAESDRMASKAYQRALTATCRSVSQVQR